jgi:uncharacterized protein involved in exopolysaccharide biosynthesis
MQQNQDDQSNQEWEDEDESSLLDLVLVVVENLKLLVFGSLAAGVLALAISYTQPNIYTAKATILPPGQDNTSAGAILRATMGGIGGIAGDIAGLKDPAQRNIAYLSSDTLRNAIIKKYDLQKRYDAKTLAETRRQLSNNVSLNSDKQTGIISIEVSDHEPKFAAELANGFVSELRVFAGKIDLQEAQNRRIFLEEQIKDVSSRSFLDQFSQQAIITGLVRQFEMAKVDEGREGPTFAQVDIATPPEAKSAPKRALVAALTSVTAGFLLLIFVFIRHALRNAEENPETSGKIQQIKALLGAFVNVRKWRLR